MKVEWLIVEGMSNLETKDMFSVANMEMIHLYR